MIPADGYRVSSTELETCYLSPTPLSLCVSLVLTDLQFQDLADSLH